MKKVLLSAILAAVMLVSGCSGIESSEHKKTSDSPAETTVIAFMDAFMESDFYNMGRQCGVYAFDDEELGIFSYSGTNIIEYNFKSISEPYKVKDRLIAKRHNLSDDEFQQHKETIKLTANYNSMINDIEYIVIDDSYASYILESNKEILDEYMVVLDVQYSTIMGDTKRNVVNIIVRQSGIGSNSYEITDMVGIVH